MSEDVEPVGPKGRCPGVPGACEGDESQAFVLYSDRHGYCHAGNCPKKFWSPKDLEERGFDLDGLDIQAPLSSANHKKAHNVDLQNLIERSDPRALPKWKVLAETTAKWDYRVYQNDKGEGIHVAVYRDEHGTPVDAKVRNAGKDGKGKDFFWANGGGGAPLYGIHLLPQAGNKVVVVEGEKDALSMSQLLTAHPVVSLPNGAGKQTKKDMAPWVERLSKFAEVVLCFDPDPAGHTATQEVARLFAPGKVSIAKLPSGKDVTELVQEGRSKDVTGAIFHPDPFRPDGIVSLISLKSEMLNPVVVGRPYAMDAQTEWTYGKRPGEVTVLGAGTGVGKSDWMIQDAAHTVAPPLVSSPMAWVNGVYQPIAVFNYEAGPQITGKAILGKLFQRRFHIPDPDSVLWSQAELTQAMEFYEAQCAQCFINDHQGAVNWESVKERIRYLRHTEGIVHAYVDPMAALVATEEDERKALDRMMAEAKMLAEELAIGLHFNSHLTRPSEGKSHEEGGRVTLKNFRGSNAIGMWASFVFGLERDQQADDPEARSITTLRVLKDRYTGNSTGKTLQLTYNQLTGMLEPLVCTAFEEDDAPVGDIAPAKEVPE